MISDLERILRWNGLDSQINRIRKILEKKEQQLDQIQSDCNHEIVVFTEEECCLGGYDDNLYQKCLFCGAKSASRHSFQDSQFVIDVSNFEKENFFSRETKFEIVKNLFIKFTNENPELSTEEIVNLVKKDLHTQDEEFRKIMASLCKK